jgi:endonuclease YncB( thermonuclease family)
LDDGDCGHGGAGIDQLLDILGEPSVAAEPSEGALDHPTLRQEVEPFSAARTRSESFQDDESLNATIVREGWALAWYPERGAILGLTFDEEEAAAAAAGFGLWRGAFIPPWKWRRQ